MVKVIGGGLAGVEATYQLAKRGVDVKLYEMRPINNTPAHKTDRLAELVCSNSLKSTVKTTASGVLKAELAMLDCLIIKAGEFARVPAGSALAVDKKLFSDYIEKVLFDMPNVEIIREEVTNIDNDDDIIVATGPLTSELLSKSIAKSIGETYLHFYDAVAPIISAESIDMNKAFFAERYGKGDADYINCPMNAEEYSAFYEALIQAKCVDLPDFDKNAVFEGCMPIEVMAKRGYDSIRFGPLRPVGISHPVTGEKYRAIVQLRQENREKTMYNLVGFQTNLTFLEQEKVFKLIPSLESAEFFRYGVMHRNTFINSPELLEKNFRLKDSNIFFAGQITGVEGYMESTMSGLIAGINMYRKLNNLKGLVPSEHTITGALCNHIIRKNENFQPMNANFGILPFIVCKDKRERKSLYADRALKAMNEYAMEVLL